MVDPILIAAKLAAPLLGKAIMPKLLERLGKEFKDMSIDMHHAFFNAFDSYTKGVFEKHSYFSSLVFPNRQLKLKDYYLPLTLLVPEVHLVTELIVDDYPGVLLTEKKDILVVDSAGMGKSTLLKFMFLRAVEMDVGIPIFLELRKFKVDESLLAHVLKQLRALDGSLNESLVVRLLESGDFLFFLDGFDEIADSDRTGVVQQLKDFKQLANKNRFIVSSRDQVGLAALSDFYRVSIKPLSFQEATKLIRKYSSGSARGEGLIDRLNRPESQPIHEFLSNPLLVSLLFKAYEHKQSLPLKKHVFYRQVYEALFENHDLSKDAGELNRSKLSRLDIHSFEIVMRALGFLSLESSKVEYPKDELLLLIEKTQTLVGGIDFNPQAFLQDLVTRVPLFVVDGNYYRWNHKSIQEYFAALYLSAAGIELQRSVLKAMYASEKATAYLNFLSLFSDIDAKGFRQILVPELIEELLLVFNSIPMFPAIPISSQSVRHGFLAFKTLVLVNLTEEEYPEFWMPGKTNLEEDQNRGAAERSRDFFLEAQRTLTNSGVNVANRGASFTPGRITVISFFDVRYQFIMQTINVLNLDFVRIAHPAQEASHRTVADDYRHSRLLPQGFSSLTMDATNTLNSLEIYDEVNGFLSESVDSIIFDATKARELRNLIETEIARQTQTTFTF